MADFDLNELIKSLPAGLDRAVLRVLSFHVGRPNAIARHALVEELARLGFNYRKDDRAVRAMINQLRKAGHLICSYGGRDGGYFLPADWNELNEYLDREVHPRAMDLLEQEKAMKAAAEGRWGRFSPGRQMDLFSKQ